jgi:hypothetical protein
VNVQVGVFGTRLPAAFEDDPDPPRDRIPAMTTVTRPGAAMSDPSLRTTHVLLTVQTAVVVLVSVNRLTSFGEAYVLPNEFLRWLDLNNMVLALASLLAFYLLLRHLSTGAPAAGATRRGSTALGLAFILGAYLLAASYGDHETTNYLHGRFCPPDDTGRLCEIIRYHDDGFSHLLFFAGFTIINLVVMLTQVRHPARRTLTAPHVAALVGNAGFIAAGIAANLAFEPIGYDLYVVAAVALAAVGLLVRYRGQPILVYYAVAYVVGLTVTAALKLAGSG